MQPPPTRPRPPSLLIGPWLEPPSLRSPRTHGFSLGRAPSRHSGLRPTEKSFLATPAKLPWVRCTKSPRCAAGQSPPSWICLLCGVPAGIQAPEELGPRVPWSVARLWRSEPCPATKVRGEAADARTRPRELELLLGSHAAGKWPSRTWILSAWCQVRGPACLFPERTFTKRLFCARRAARCQR